MALKLATKTALIESVQNHLVETYTITRPDGGESLSITDLQGDETLSHLFEQFFEPKKSTKKTTKQEKPKKVPSPKQSLEDRQAADNDHSRCLCRTWKPFLTPDGKSTGTGYDNIQCTFGTAGEDGYCKTHAKKVADHGPWWLGKVTEPRPEEPFGPYGLKAAPSRHYWSDQSHPEKVKKAKKSVEMAEQSDKTEKPEKKEKKEQKEKKVKKKVSSDPEQEAVVPNAVQEPVSDAVEQEPVQGPVATITTPVVDGDTDEEEVSEVLSTDHNSYDNDAPFSDDESSDSDVSESDDDDDDSDSD
jgi:hypothetical protein